MPKILHFADFHIDMAQIWKMSYVEDMNTLYTHMAYLRRAIEQDLAAPRYLLTG